MILGELLPWPTKIFSGVVGCGSGISAADLPSLEAGIEALGGQWRHGLTKDVTHLFATSADSEKYAIAMQYQDTTHVKVLLPHWFDDAIRLGSAKLPTLPYEWPDPKVLHPLPSVEEAKIEKTARGSQRGPFPGPAEPVSKVWDGRKIILSFSLGLDDERRRVVEEAEADQVPDCNILITSGGLGPDFSRYQAVRANKIIGTLNWLFPMDQLLHYPVKKIPLLHDFTKHQITVTNYTGEAREYLKRLIQIMGATFTPNMSGENTVLIAANMGGEKTQKALAWNIAVVNHVWLEDCFVDWRDITPAVPKYIDFPPNLDFAPMLGERGVKLNLDHLGDEEEEDQAARERPPVGTEASVREVEGILNNGNVIMDNQDTEEAEQCLAPATSRSKAPSSRRMVSASVSPAKHRSTDDADMEVDEPPKAVKGGKQRAQGEETSMPPKRGKQPEGKGKARQAVAEAEDEEQEPHIELTRKAKPNGNGKEREKPAKAASKVTFAPETEASSAGPSNSRASKKTSTTTTTTTSKRKAAQLMESASNDNVADDGNQSDSPPPKKRAKSAKGASATPSTSTSGPAASSSSGKRKMTAGPGRDSAPRRPERTESIRAAADERVAKTGSKSKPAAGSSSAAGSKKKTVRTEVESEDEEEEVMPDVVNYELEGRTQRARVSAGKKQDDDSADEMPPPKATKAKAKKETPKSTPKETPKSAAKETPKAAAKGAAKKADQASPNTSSSSRKPTGAVKIMTTTITLPDNVVKALAKLGAKTASQISECTHLIAPGLVRTEKLLCALAAGAFIVSDKWAIDSAAAKKLLPEGDYILRDKVNEKKWNFRLADAMERVRESGGKLFENKTFYVTAGVSVDTKLLKTVVAAQGGKLMTSTPTVRILNSAPNRYVISCPEDKSIWRPLTKDHTVYSQELLLTAALTQKIDWDNPAFQVAGQDA
ncbi:hypothetical protein K438DRAFT_1809538 [Mycena galopus ATCC 62051]|nr:hypothetical protein K438DRAFT_1809538 [Mycena galopus ATCC 62051]